MESQKNLDVEILTIDKIENHPNADKLEVIHLKGYQAVYSKGKLNPGETVLYIKTDAQINLEMAWSLNVQKFLGKHGRVKTVPLRDVYSEGIIITKDNINPYFPWESLIQMDNETLAKTLGIKHYEAIMTNQGDLQVKNNILPFDLPKTDQENVQSIPKEDILNRKYLVTKKKDGSSCTIVIHKTDQAYNISITSRSMDLKPDADNIYTIAARPIIESVLNTLDNKSILKDDNILVIRGEVCGASIQRKAINKDAEGNPHFTVFEIFSQKRPGPMYYKDRTYFPLSQAADKHYFIYDFPALPYVPAFKVITLKEEHIDEYLLKPISEGEGVVLWEIKEDHQFGLVTPTGYSFKIRSKEYDSKM